MSKSVSKGQTQLFSFFTKPVEKPKVSPALEASSGLDNVLAEVKPEIIVPSVPLSSSMNDTKVDAISKSEFTSNSMEVDSARVKKTPSLKSVLEDDDGLFDSDEDEKPKFSRKRLRVQDDDEDDYSEPKEPLKKVVISTPARKTPSKDKDASNWSQSSYASNNTSVESLTPPSPAVFSSPNTGLEEASEGSGGVLMAGQHEHNFWSFLLPASKKDASGKRPDHPEYNPRTVSVPLSFLDKQTPGMRQWCDFKFLNMDTVLFFKVGKFYELFHMDADIGVQHLDLIYMKGEKAHSGFPEISYGKYSSMLISKGFRVARVEQTETPEMLKERNENTKGKKSKVVLREICSVLSRGTRTYSHIDDVSMLEDESASSLSSESLLVCIKERKIMPFAESDAPDGKVAVVEYGVCCVDTVLANIVFAQFQDDEQRSRLRTMLAQFTPSEVILEYNHYSAGTEGAIKLVAPKTAWEFLRGNEMPTANETVKMIKVNEYFSSANCKNSKYLQSQEMDLLENGRVPVVCNSADFQNWPELVQMLVENINNDARPSDLVMSAFGGAIWQLRRCLIDLQIVSCGKCTGYVPPDEEGNKYSSEENAQVDRLINESLRQKKHMTLDAVVLSNLEVLVNNFDHTAKGSLWAFMNRTKTPFGKRLLHSWLCKPLFEINEIKFRSNAVENLLSHCSVEMNKVQNLMKSLPDLERLLARVHCNGNKKKNSEHPDSRAVFFEQSIHNTRKIKEFADILGGFETLVKIGEVFSSSSSPINSELLKRVVCSPANGQGRFPVQEMAKLLQYYRTIFDEKQAKRDGNIKPLPGVDPDYDNAKREITEINAALEDYLREMKKETGISELVFWGSNKDRFQIEVPIGKTGKLPRDWTTKSQKKTHRRYWTPKIEQLFEKLTSAEDKMATAQKGTLCSIFAKFDENIAVWSVAVNCIAILDSLISLALVSSSPNYAWPNIVGSSETTGSFIKIENGRHPMLELSLLEKGLSYIPNGLSLGGGVKGTGGLIDYNPRMLLLSGPNMGGKSTLLRQVCLIAIMAQLGCKVPADSCIMTPVDRIFTRVGASDKILAGQSTFFVELAETANILQSATADSLCILDELGRGTATFDGTSIAHAVLDHLVNNVHCRCLFATHYHSLVNEWAIDPRVHLGHMDCVVDTAAREDRVEQVTFLYKLCNGASPRSYGINVARLAKLPQRVIDIAMQQSINFENKMNNIELKGTVEYWKSEQIRMISEFFLHLSGILKPLHSEKCVDQELVYFVQELWNRFTHKLNVSSVPNN